MKAGLIVKYRLCRKLIIKGCFVKAGALCQSYSLKKKKKKEKKKKEHLSINKRLLWKFGADHPSLS